MANYEKRVGQEAAYPISLSLYNCYRTVRHDKRYEEYIALPLFSSVESPTEISRDFICNVTSSAWDYLAKSGQDGWLERSGDGASLGQEYGAVSGGIGCQRIAFVND